MCFYMAFTIGVSFAALMCFMLSTVRKAHIFAMKQLFLVLGTCCCTCIIVACACVYRMLRKLAAQTMIKLQGPYKLQSRYVPTHLYPILFAEAARFFLLFQFISLFKQNKSIVVIDRQL